MRSTLHKFFLAPVVMAAAALAINTASAETVKVPFNFTVHNQTWPAGTYSVTRGTSSNLIYVASQDGTKSLSCVVGPGEPEPGAKEIKLQFDELGGTHVLRTVQYKSLVSSALDKKDIKEAMYAPSRLSQGR